MTEEQQRIAIAQFCGWKDCHKSIGGFDDGDGIIDRYVIGIPPNCTLHRKLPDYPRDLNAMHEAMLLHPRKELLRDFLYLEVLEDPTNKTNEPAWATAKQWAVAYVRSIGKWEDKQ